MKLFQSLLVAPAVLGLITPISATATELNLKDASNYSEVTSIPSFSEIYPTDWTFKAITDVATSRGCLGLIPEGTISRSEAASIINSCVKNVAQLTEQEQVLIKEFNPELALLRSRVDGLDARMSEFEAGGFSATTSAAFSADFAIGAVDGVAAEDAVGASYGFQIDLSTTFTGDDSFDVSLDAGSNTGTGTDVTTELDLNGTGDTLVVDGISYTFPLGDKTTVFVGNNMDGSTLFSTACVYGGPTNALDDCGNNQSAMAAGKGTAFGASYDVGNGFTAAFGYEGNGDTTPGLMTAEGEDAYGVQVAYSQDNYGISLTYASIEQVLIVGAAAEDTTWTGFNAYFDPEGEGLPSISVGYEWGDFDDQPAATDYSTHYFVGFQWDEIGPGTLGTALGTKTPTIEGQDEELMYEAWYSYPLNDGMTITPVVYIKENSAANTDDETGVMLKTSFSF